MLPHQVSHRYHHHDKRRQSHSPTSSNRRISQYSTGHDRSREHDRCADTNERQYHANDLYGFARSQASSISIDKLLNDIDKHPPTVQAIIQEVFLEQTKRRCIEERLSACERDYAHLCAQHEMTMSSMVLLKHDYDRCRVDLRNASAELNELRHHNYQLKTHIDQLLPKEREQFCADEKEFYAKRRRRH